MQENNLTEKIETARERLYMAYNANANPGTILRLSQELDILIVAAYKKNVELGFIKKSDTKIS